MSEMSKSWLSAILSRVWSRSEPPPPPPIARIRPKPVVPAQPRRAAPPVEAFSAPKAKPEASSTAAAVATLEREAPSTAPVEGDGALPNVSLASRLATLAEAEDKLTILKPDWAERQATGPEAHARGGDAVEAKLEPARVEVGREKDVEAAPTPAVSSLETLIAEAANSSTWRHRFSAADAPVSPPGDNYTYEFETVDETVCLKLGNGVARAPSGGLTAGYNIRVSDELELAASEKTIRITIVARSDGAGDARFAVAYSTNDAGNSGWQACEVGTDWRLSVVEYQAPKMKRAKGDFVGLLPSPAGQPGVLVAAIAIAVLG